MITITSPASGATVSGIVHVTGTTSQSVNGVALAAQSFDVTFDTSTYTNGSNTFTVSNQVNSASITLNVLNGSADGTTIPSASSITDGANDVWTLVSGRVTKNGTGISIGSPSAIQTLLYYGGVMYAYNGTTWYQNPGSTPWTVISGDPRGYLTLTKPANGAMSGTFCTVAGTTNATSVTIKDGSTVLATVTPVNGSFSKQVTLNRTIGSHTITVTAGGATATSTVTIGSPTPSRMFYGMNGHMAWGDTAWATTYSKAQQRAYLQDLGCTMYRADVASATMANVIKTSLQPGGDFYAQGIGFIPVLNGVSAGWSTNATETDSYNLGKNLAVAVATALNGYVDYIECGNELDVPIKIAGNGSNPTDWNQATWASYRGVLRGMVDGIKSVNPDIQVGVNIGIPMGYGALMMLWNGTEPNGSTGKPTVKWDFTAYHWYKSSGDIEHAAGAQNVNIPQLLQDQFGVPTMFTEWGWSGSNDTQATASTYVSTAMTQYRNDANFRMKYNVICIMHYALIDANYGLIQTDGVTKNTAYGTMKTFIANNPV